MTVYSTLLLAAAGLAAADKLAAMNLGEASGRGITVAAPGSSDFGVHSPFGVHSLSDGCGIGMTTCDSNCMPLTGICCGLGSGAYCDIGYTCESDGCCPVGKVCTGPPTGCEGDRDLCGEFCVPKGTCSSGGGGGGGGGSGGGDGGCPTGYEACDDECMPTGSVCCHNGYHCDAGQTCTADFKCRIGSGGGGGGSGGGSGGDGGDDQTTSRGGSSGSQTTYSLSPNPEPTATSSTESNPFGGDDATTTSQDSFPEPTQPPATTSSSSSSSSGGSNGGSSGGSSGSSSGGSNGGNGGSGGSIVAPSILVGLLALVPFVL
ncbi:hypothetical protein M431DRAFT_111064 [Trichoderma harzianum CBS 226.95]|uniref:Carbohydrate-binding module family 18 protein n=1 Tax=Trichoderma harzianum CBS 226.95 TaxID=983964 RepID=A0A2T4AH81_TRIHA|nr:hypothetical protein M431DRAFT_111064 [Trichoderma harzianum CBS 226.95]PTB56278.1 hypothetical protein M431DRAFT_111064 [Trichoderma harzianum CBS 226.95]